MRATDELVASTAALLADRYAGRPWDFAAAGREAGSLARNALEALFREPGCPEELVRCGASLCCCGLAAFRPVLDAAGAGTDDRQAFAYGFAVAIDDDPDAAFVFAGRSEAGMQVLECSPNRC